ncbi:MAG: membrane associated rhomboid family serine protease [Flavobacteriales bacterium]
MLFSITNIIIGITCLTSYNAFNNRDLKYKMMCSPYAIKHHNKWWQLLSHGFVHADVTHLFFNMFVLYSFGNIMEVITVSLSGQVAGTLIYLVLYFGGLALASVPSLIKHGDNINYHSLGASGAVSAVLMAFIILFPTNILELYFAIPIPAWLFGGLYIAFETYSNKNGRSNVAHDAHLAGLAFGAIMMFVLYTSDAIQIFSKIAASFS